MNRGIARTGWELSRREFNATVSAAAIATACGSGELVGFGKSADQHQCARCVERALDFLEWNAWNRDEALVETAGVGVMAIAATAMLRHGRSVHNPFIAKSLGCIANCAHAEGGIHAPGQGSANHDTCLAILCLAAANEDRRYDGILDRAETFIRSRQWTESRRKEPDDLAYGGAGYGKHRRPDLFNTTLFIDALTARGRKADDPAVRKALVFVSRCQNIESPYNATPFAVRNPDGGFYDSCDAGGNSKAGSTPSGGLQSYASTTCNGLRSMLRAGLSPDEPRVCIAVDWIRNHYTLVMNPGLGEAGLFYYHAVLAETLDVLGIEVLEDTAGTKHSWRDEMAESLRQVQRPSGSWANEDGRWMEAKPVVATARALLAMSYCRPSKEHVA